ncbi:hypothetical protein [Nitrosovibrio sp. Nv6]|uniref:hypothetical protein n=1 Tax=Nitrosovibrio sp. Nv6 TaxID=1855340 RepID=UPI0008D886CC|nr:hypothetical protein [Nitrosovibrio sp. Nv6]SEP26930.1 hypothetical protein SAMN05216316_2229 [Nitrosovibrio sp. Nv6]
MLRKILFLILVSALAFVPVLQAAHALTHVGEADTGGMAHADGQQEESETDTDAGIDSDRICLDCLALTGFSVIFAVLAIFFRNRISHQPLPYFKSGLVLLNFSSLYLTRGPPQA